MGEAFTVTVIILLVLTVFIVGIFLLVKYYEKEGGPLIDISILGIQILDVRDRMPGETCDNDGNCVKGCCQNGICSTPVAEGGACSSTCECDPGLGCVSDVCTVLSESGGPCGNPPTTDNDTCSNNTCGRILSNGNVEYICCPSGSDTLEADAFERCTGQKSGSECYYDGQCASLNCIGGGGILYDIGTCE